MSEFPEDNNVHRRNEFNHKEFSESNTRLQLDVLLGLAATKRTSVGSCPSPQQLALFTDGQLTKKRRNQVLAHLNQCDQCRSIWLETAAYLDTHPRSQAISLGQGIFRKISEFLSPSSLIISSLTVAILVLAVIIPHSDLNYRIDSSFQILLDQNQSQAINIANVLTMPWDNSVMGFARPNDRPEKKAFGAGLWDGKGQITSTRPPLPDNLVPVDKEHWQDTEWSSYYQFGRLVVLLWVETQMIDAQVHWEQYEKTLTSLRERLVKQTTDVALKQSVVSSLEQIQDQIKKIKQSSALLEVKSLKRLLEIIMQKYSPG